MDSHGLESHSRVFFLLCTQSMAGYADALGAKARNGYSAFLRQDFIGADYGLLDCATALPLPDYFTALLFARLMGPRALDVRATRTSGIGARGSSETASAPLSVAAMACSSRPRDWESMLL